MCQPALMDKSDTVGLIELFTEPYGRCVNSQPVIGFYECSGACKSQSIFDRQLLRHDQICECCSISNYEQIEVTLECDDGSEQIALVPVAKSCSCVYCGGEAAYEQESHFRIRDTEPSENPGEADNQKYLKKALGWILNFNDPSEQPTFRMRIN